MANVRPFRGFRYNQERVKDVYQLFSPLLDVVDTEQLEELYKNPANSIHLSVPQSNEAVICKLNEWKSENILQQEVLPAIYVYYQTFQLPTENKPLVRKGFVSMVEMKKGEYDDILLHEDTLTHSVEKRVELLEQTLFNVIPTHGLYEDTNFELEKLMDEYIQSPLYEYEDFLGVKTQFAIVQNANDIAKFIKVLKNKRIYLADGHHRLESSKVLRNKLADDTKQSMVNFHLMYLTNLKGDDLRILPTHRIWKPKEQVTLAAVLSRMFPYWKVTDVSDYPQPLYTLMQGKKYAFGLIHGRKEYLIEIRLGLQTNIPLEMPEVWKQLNYTVLHYYFFEKAAYIPYSEQNKSDEISYEKSYSSAIEAAREGAFTFICQEVEMQEIISVCEAGVKMPQKSTYFYPKVLCGLVFSSIKDEENNSTIDTRFSISS